MTELFIVYIFIMFFFVSCLGYIYVRKDENFFWNFIDSFSPGWCKNIIETLSVNVCKFSVVGEETYETSETNKKNGTASSIKAKDDTSPHLSVKKIMKPQTKAKQLKRR